MADDEITHWLELPAGMGFVPFAELAHLIARARFPVAPEDEECDFAYGGARVNLDEELPKAVAAGLLKVRDPLTHGPHTFPHGFALQRAVVKVSDLRAYLADRGMGVRVMEAGNGPTLWTIENAAAAIAAQEGWHGHARDTLKEQMMQAARDGILTVRNPHTDLPYRPESLRGWYELVTPADVNKWLASVGARYRWATYEVAVAEPTKAEPTAGLGHAVSARQSKDASDEAQFARHFDIAARRLKLQAEHAALLAQTPQTIIEHKTKREELEFIDGALRALVEEEATANAEPPATAVTTNNKQTREVCDERKEQARNAARAIVKVEAARLTAGDPAVAAPVRAAAAAALTGGNVTHSTKPVHKRRDALTPVIELAQGKCLDPNDTPQVYAQMEVLAQAEHPPLLAATPDGLKYTKNGNNAYLKRDALDKRLHPEKRQRGR